MGVMSRLVVTCSCDLAGIRRDYQLSISAIFALFGDGALREGEVFAFGLRGGTRLPFFSCIECWWRRGAAARSGQQGEGKKMGAPDILSRASKESPLCSLAPLDP